MPYVTELDLDLICYVDAKWVCGFFLLVLRSKHNRCCTVIARQIHLPQHRVGLGPSRREENRKFLLNNMISKYTPTYDTKGRKKADFVS